MSSRIPTPKPKYWFTADQHRGHGKVIVKGGRPFSDVQHQDECLDDEWARCVKPQDIVYVLGDFSFYDPRKTSAILARLPGQKNLIKGNHDSSKNLKQTSGWNMVTPLFDTRFDGHEFSLCHFPMMSWKNSHWGAYHLHGHCHGNLQYPESHVKARIMDVGVDAVAALGLGYRPISLEEVLERLSSRPALGSAHHEAQM